MERLFNNHVPGGHAMNCRAYHGGLTFSRAPCAGDCQVAYKAHPVLACTRAGIRTRKEGERTLIQAPPA